MSAYHDEFAAVLLARRIISPEQLVEAWQLAVATGVRLADALVKLGYATTEQVMAAIAECSGMQFIDLSEVTIPPVIIELVPESVARENIVLPLSLDGPVLKIIMSDPTDVATMEKLQFILNKQIIPVLSPREQIIEAINRHYGQSETESIDSMLAEFTDTAIDFTETEATWNDVPSGIDLEMSDISLRPVAGPRSMERRATIRYYHRMNPQRMFPLLVILSRDEVEEVVKRGVRQASGDAFRVAEGSVVEIEPVLPGCACYPPREQVRIGAGDVSVTFWIVPEVLGRVMQARVVVRQGDEVLSQVPLEVCIVRQGLTKLMGALSLVLPFVLLLLKHLGLDFESQTKEDFALYARIAGWLVQHLTPEWLTGLLLAATVGLYFYLRPRQREVFWDIKTHEPAAESPEPTDADALFAEATEAFERGDDAALGLYEQALAAGNGRSIDYFRASLAANRTGDLHHALNILQKAEAVLPPGEMKGPLWYNMGCFAARLGQFADALRYLNRAVDAGFADLEKYRTDDDLSMLRWHKGFRRLLADLAVR
jgi:hypothetical protein